MYEPSDYIKNYLTYQPKEVEVCFTHLLKQYFKDWSEPVFVDEMGRERYELKVFWFYLKVHELTEQAQLNTIIRSECIKRLTDELNVNGQIFYNRHYKLGHYKREEKNERVDTRKITADIYYE